MKSRIKISNIADECHIDIEGTIGVPEEWQFDDPQSRVTTYQKFKDSLALIGEISSPKVVINIRSTGGDVNDALLIYDALSSLEASITTRCYGYTASAATIIAQAASKGQREISPNALYLIHNSICSMEGNVEELESKVDLLRQTDQRLSELYAARSGRDKAQIAQLMAQNGGQGRWLSPEEAIEAGLVDRLTSSNSGEENPLDPSTDANPKPNTTGGVKGKIGELLAAIGLPKRGAEEAEQMPQDVNVLHLEPDVKGAQGLPKRAAQVASQVAMAEAQKSVQPTRTKRCEDPSVREMQRSANERAYAQDMRRLTH